MLRVPAFPVGLVTTARLALAGLLVACSAPPRLSGDVVDGEPEDLRVALSSGAMANWTRLVVEVEKRSAGSGVSGGQAATEELARRQIGPAILDGLPQVHVRTDETLGTLLDDPEVGPVIHNRVKKWSVVEARYHASGPVVLVGELDLGDVLRPWLMDRVATPPDTPTVTAYTGLVLDARGTSAEPAVVPRILADDGSDLWNGRLWPDAAVSSMPAIWVADPGHPAVVRAGDSPLVVRVRRSRDADLELDEAGTGAVRRHLLGTPILGEGRVVILVDR